MRRSRRRSSRSARLAGWAPLPLSVRDARRAARPLRERLASITPPTRTAADARRHHRAALRRRRALRADRRAARHRPLDRTRRDRRGHGPQRRGEVDAAAAAVGAHAPDLGTRDRRRRDPALAGRRRARAQGRARALRSGRAALRTHHRVRVLGRRPRAPSRRRNHARDARPHRSGTRSEPSSPRPARRVNGSRSRSRSCSRPRRR